MEILRTLATLAEPPTAEARRLAELLELGEAPDETDWTETFVFQLPPYASIYLSADGRLGGEPRDRVAGFWRALGLEPPGEPDHLPVLLAFQAELAQREAEAPTAQTRARWRNARRAFFHEHVGSWLPFYLATVEEHGGEFYRRWSALLQIALAEEGRQLGPMAAEPAHFRDVPPLEHPERMRSPGDTESAARGADLWLEALLAPLRSGLFLPRAALRRGALELGLGERLGERRLALRTFLSQDAAATLSWLAEQARAAATSHRRAADAMPRLAAFWIDRATSSAKLLETLASPDRGA